MDIDIINQEFLFWLWPVKLSIRHNSFIRKLKSALIWCSYHFKTPFRVILQYPQLKREILQSKEKAILSQAALRILCRMDIYFKRLVIYQSGIRINISNTKSAKVLSNLQFKLIFSVLTKSCKNEYICPSDIRHNYFFKHYPHYHRRFFRLVRRLKVTAKSQ